LAITFEINKFNNLPQPLLTRRGKKLLPSGEAGWGRSKLIYEGLLVEFLFRHRARAHKCLQCRPVESAVAFIYIQALQNAAPEVFAIMLVIKMRTV
jgi:hypothetical protein